MVVGLRTQRFADAGCREQQRAARIRLGYCVSRSTREGRSQGPRAASGKGEDGLGRNFMWRSLFDDVSVVRRKVSARRSMHIPQHGGERAAATNVTSADSAGASVLFLGGAVCCFGGAVCCFWGAVCCFGWCCLLSAVHSTLYCLLCRLLRAHPTPGRGQTDSPRRQQTAVRLLRRPSIRQKPAAAKRTQLIACEQD